MYPSTQPSEKLSSTLHHCDIPKPQCVIGAVDGSLPAGGTCSWDTAPARPTRTARIAPPARSSATPARTPPAWTARSPRPADSWTRRACSACDPTPATAQRQQQQQISTTALHARIISWNLRPLYVNICIKSREQRWLWIWITNAVWLTLRRFNAVQAGLFFGLDFESWLIEWSYFGDGWYMLVGGLFALSRRNVVNEYFFKRKKVIFGSLWREIDGSYNPLKGFQM